MDTLYTFISRGKNDSVCLREGKGHVDANGSFILSDRGNRVIFHNGTFDTRDLEEAARLYCTNAVKTHRVIVGLVNGQAPTEADIMILEDKAKELGLETPIDFKEKMENSTVGERLPDGIEMMAD